MKLLKWIFILIAFLGLIFLAIGLIFPTTSFTNTMIVDAPVEKSWHVFSEEDNLEKWISGLKRVEHISGTPEGIGSKYKMFIEENGQKMEMIETVTANTKNEKYAFFMENDFFNGDVEILFEKQGLKTKIVANNSFYGHDIIKRSMLFLMKSMISTENEKQYNKLKELIESSPDRMEDGIPEP